MRLSLNRNSCARTRGLLAAGALFAGCASPAATSGAPVCVQRHLALMGTWLDLEVEAAARETALAASERAASALEQAEQRLSTWRAESELSRLNRSALGEPFELSRELACELAAARTWWQATRGAFDPAVGGLVEAWGLRGSGRRPSEDELALALVEGGFAALELGARSATRRAAGLRLEEGGFGKGAGLDAALAALAEAGATRACVDLGGQVAVLGAEQRPFERGIAHPERRGEVVLSLDLARGSLATSGNSERGLALDGEPIGHLLDPRSGRPAADFGSVSVLAPTALAADCLSTGLFVLGPEAALDFGRAEREIDVLVLEPLPNGTLRARATGALARALEVRSAAVALERLPDLHPSTSGGAPRAAVSAIPSVP